MKQDGQSGEQKADLFESLKQSSHDDVRGAIRRGDFCGQTAGLAPGKLQANLVILPEVYALDFMRFCQRNPKPCPVTGVSDTGNPKMFTMGRDIDIRTDVPQYNIYRDGVLRQSVTDIVSIWRDDFVAFSLGCSFTFEHAAMQAGIALWHVQNNTTVPMFRTNMETIPAGPFCGEMVVSMRAIPEQSVDLIKSISNRFPLAHGGPVHIGNPGEIGVHDVSSPDWGDPAPVPQGSVPVFWACGVTPQVALENAQVPIVITHKPGHMLITDVSECAQNPNLTTT